MPRYFMRQGSGLVFLLILSLWVRTTGLQAQEPKQPPNFIFILADDLGWGDLGCYGNREIQTPNLDRLAREGMLFTHYYANSPVCSPTRAALLTGQFPAKNRIRAALAKNSEKNASYSNADQLDPNVITMADYLAERGYRTSHYGKWHLGDQKKISPSEYGFQEYRFGEKGFRIRFPKKRPYSSEMIMDEVIQFIERNQGRPFYVNAWLLDVHTILYPTDEQMEAYEDLSVQGIKYPNPAQVYYAAVTEMDRQVGRLLEKLDQLDLSQRTIVIFTSDNGPEVISSSGARHSGVGSTGPFRGKKMSLYEGGIRVPMLVRWPGNIPAERVNSTVISSVDFLPTFCRLAGIEKPAAYEGDGEDMSEAFLGEKKDRHKVLYWEYLFRQSGHPIGKSPMLAVREGRWKLLMNPDGSRVELYDIKKDPMEVDNLAAGNPDVVQDLSEKLLNWHQSMPPARIVRGAGANTYPWPKEKKTKIEHVL